MSIQQNRVLIIAEAGVNHNGDINIAKCLVDEAARAGADAVKFQTFKAHNVITQDAKKADYQKEGTSVEESQLEMLKKLELSYAEFIDLRDYCEHKNIVFLSTPFDMESIDFLAQLNLAMWKIPSGEITNLPYLIKIAETKRPVVLSTGMSTLAEITDALKILRAYGSTDISLLHCNTEYPTPFKDANLRAIITLQKQFKVSVGYSDHTRGIEASIAAVALGATIIEKHFTTNKQMDGPDHRASLEPYELRAMIDSIRNIEEALGNGEKRPTESELKNKNIARKSLVANETIKKGDAFTDKNLTVKRPGDGISPLRWFEIIGQTAIKDFEEDDLIEI